jgi:hypothetical protein
MISISKGVCTLQAQSLTICGKAMAGSASAGESAPYKHNHLQTVGRQWQDQHQQRGLHNHLLPVGRQWQHQHQQGSFHLTSIITYNLWEGNGRISISKGVCTLQAQSLTICRKTIVGLASARGSALCKHNHLLSIERQWQH